MKKVNNHELFKNMFEEIKKNKKMSFLSKTKIMNL